METTTAAAALTAEQIALLPTDAEVARYRETGYYLSRKLFSDDEIYAALAGGDRFYAGAVDDLGADERLARFPGKFRPKGEYAPDALRKNDYASFQNRELHALVRHPLLGAVAARLAGAPVRLWHDQLLYKPVEPPGGKPANVGWHTDRGYWKTCTSANMLTAWIPFHDCDATMGTITMIEGSQHWPDNTNHLDFFSSDLEGLEAKFVTGGRPVVKVPMNLPKGHVSFHHCLVIHGSGPNKGSHPRRSIAVHLQDEANRYQEYVRPGGVPARHANDTLVNKDGEGKPDYADPLICPELGRP